MIRSLGKQTSDLYLQVKETVLGPDFPWHWHEKAYLDDEVTEDTCNFGFLSHVILERPGHSFLCPKINSEYFDMCHELFLQICNNNDIHPQVLYRINANFTFLDDPLSCNKYGPPHTDHNFPHKNMLVYLTSIKSGLTRIGDQHYMGLEDEAMMFEGIHQHMLPMSGRRVVLVYTFLL